MQWNRRVLAMLVFVLPWAVAVPAQERAELLAGTTVLEDARSPRYAALTPEQVAGALTAVSGRNYAWFGFNTPEIHVVLPGADNSVYAVVEFDPPTVVDDHGHAVPYELERGLYDHDTHHDEIRLAPVDGEDPIVYARAAGTVTVRYPLRIRTLTARRGQALPEGLDVTFDGPFVIRRTPPDHEDPAAAAFTGISPVRALDASGSQLKEAPTTSVSVSGELRTQTSAFWGEVAALQVDVVEEWARVELAYDLPAVAPLPEERSGIAPSGGDENPPTPGGAVTVTIVEETPGDAVAARLGLTRAGAADRLRELGYPEPSGKLMVMSAVQGKSEDVQLFLAAGVPVDFADDERTALVSAIMYGHFELARFLVEAGADVDLADANNATPLFHAAGKCTASDLVRALLDAGADPTPATRGGMTADGMATVMGCTDNQAMIAAALGG